MQKRAVLRFQPTQTEGFPSNGVHKLYRPVKALLPILQAQTLSYLLHSYSGGVWVSQPTSTASAATQGEAFIPIAGVDAPLPGALVNGRASAVFEWSPLSLGATVRLDLDSRYVTLNGDDRTKVDAMLDRSGNGYHATVANGAGVGATAPTYTTKNSLYNDKPSLSFTGTNLLKTAGVSADIGASLVTIFMVGHLTGVGTPPYAVGRSSELAIGSADALKWRLVENGGGFATVQDCTVPSIIAAIFDGGSSYLYPTSYTPELVLGSAHTITAGNGWGIGNYTEAPQAGFCWEGPIVRVIIVMGALSTERINAGLAGLATIYDKTIVP